MAVLFIFDLPNYPRVFCSHCAWWTAACLCWMNLIKRGMRHISIKHLVNTAHYFILSHQSASHMAKIKTLMAEMQRDQQTFEKERPDLLGVDRHCHCFLDTDGAGSVVGQGQKDGRWMLRATSAGCSRERGKEKEPGGGKPCRMATLQTELCEIRNSAGAGNRSADVGSCLGALVDDNLAATLKKIVTAWVTQRRLQSHVCFALNLIHPKHREQNKYSQTWSFRPVNVLAFYLQSCFSAEKTYSKNNVIIYVLCFIVALFMLVPLCFLFHYLICW